MPLRPLTAHRGVALAALLAACAGPAEDTGHTPGPAPRIFSGSAYHLGDPHVHTGFSGDASGFHAESCPDCGRFGEVFEHAKGAGLSWMAISDHVNGQHAATARGFSDLQAAVRSEHAPEVGFVTLPSAEVWFRAPEGDLGHKTLLLFGEDDTLGELVLADVQPTADAGMDVAACADVWTWADALEARVGPLLLVPHHPAGDQPMPTDWSCADSTRQPVVEVYSEHGNSLGDFYDPPWAGLVRDGSIPYALDPEGAAQQMGFVGGTDSHDTLPGDVCAIDLVRTDQPYGGGLTMAVLPEGTALSRAALLDAFTTRRVYATSGPNVVFDLTWSAGGAALGGLGDAVAVPAGADLTVTVTLPDADAAAVTAVEAIGPAAFRRDLEGGDGTWTLTVPDAEIPAYLYVTVVLDGAVLYPEGCSDGGTDTVERAWSSPSWFSRE